MPVVVMQLVLILVLQSDWTPEFSASMGNGKGTANPEFGWASRKATANVRKQCS